ALLEVLLDETSQYLIAGSMLAQAAPTPRVKAGPRHLELGAHPGHFEPLPLPRDEGEPLAFSCAQKRSNFFRKSCSFCSASSSRLSRAYFDICTIEGAFAFALAFGLGRGCLASRPSRDCLRQRDSMKGWMSSASATSLTLAPGALLSRTAVRLSSKVYRLTFLGPFRAAIKHL